MNALIASLRGFAQSLAASAAECAGSLGARRLAWGSLALAAVILLSVNLISSMTLRGWKADLTEDRLYTISDGTRIVLKSIDEPIKARVYYSRKLGEVAPSYGRYFDRVRALLEQYRDLSGGKLELEFVEPEPFSDAEDKAVAAGLRGLRLNAEGEVGYFGLVATNATDNQETIAFFQPDRESFVEYDVTKLVHTLSSPKKRVVGLMTSLPIDGGKPPSMMANPAMAEQQQPTPPWLIMDQIREFFEVEKVDQNVSEIPPSIDVLFVAQPTQLTPEAAYAIDQFALRGGKVLAFIDPAAEAAQLQLLQSTGQGRTELAKLLAAWGVTFDGTKVAADIAHARRVQFGGRGAQGMVTEFVAWLGLDRRNIDERDVLSGGINNLNVASAGILTPVEGRTTTVTPILHTSSDAMEIESQKVGMGADPLSLLRAYKPGGKELTLAARISGKTKSAFPNGKPGVNAKSGEDKTPGAEGADASKPAAKEIEGETAEPKGQAAGRDHLAEGAINVVVVADTDLLADQFWVESRQLMGQDVVIPSANNASFVVGALENLTGSDALIALRGRGIKERPFTLVEDLRREAERQFREKEQSLTERLKTVEQELAKLEASGQGGAVIMSDAEREAVDKAKAEMLSTRRELRNVKLALRQSIDNLDGWLKFANIALVPLLIAGAGLGFALWRKRAASA